MAMANKNPIAHLKFPTTELKYCADLDKVFVAVGAVVVPGAVATLFNWLTASDA